ncbi:4'-phosphopantetheinyl transferase family protein [Flavobacterium taihuense]|uniref:4'-phosphopantetheinyl transferase superfamily protein n=1 Tax=Flavobacterium taihuense TaxID=2857508 RepID=A0ABS6XS46_9FLAO|nr:4'-phosphopantetheinyl transferase superfamily protein [Flavobacterium taihuense]MBW4359481.1 4'-phosphopantetheinyl transferase superfamily protein [Flavobacterium taihuense]
MPLYKAIVLNPSTQILVWEITESYQELFEAVVLNDSNMNRLNGMKSEIHQRAFLSVRKLFQIAGYTDFDLYYDEFGKPHLHDGKHISITHSHQFSAIILSDEVVGIDIELQREKIIRIADKFADTEFSFLNPDEKTEYIRKLTVIWGVKEAIFKIRNEKGISFRDHIKVEAFEMNDLKTKSELHFDSIIKEFNVCFEEFESKDNNGLEQNFTLVYAFE